MNGYNKMGEPNALKRDIIGATPDDNLAKAIAAAVIIALDHIPEGRYAHVMIFLNEAHSSFTVNSVEVVK